MESARLPLHNLLKIAAQCAGQLADLSPSFFADWQVLQGFAELIEQLAGKRREVVNEIERVLDLMGNARSQLTQ